MRVSQAKTQLAVGLLGSKKKSFLDRDRKTCLVNCVASVLGSVHEYIYRGRAVAGLGQGQG